MSTAGSSTARPSSQPRDQLILQVENVPLVGRLLMIEIFEVPNVAPTKATGTPSSTGRSTPSSASTSARTNGFHVAARDDVENEYSLFVSHQKAEYLYRAAYPVEAAASETFTSEAMANGILAHLNIIGNRQRDVGKLVCRDPEPYVEKKSRILPLSTPPNKQRNPHLPSKRQDQRAVRVQKRSKRTMEAVAKAMQRPGHDNSGDEENEVEAGKLDRKSSEASLLHRMAVADSKTMWKAELETNYEEADHPFSLVEGDEGNEQKIPVYTLAPGLSPVKRALPERKTKHKDLEERRQRGRQQRILIAQAAQEVNSAGFQGSIQAQGSYSTLVEESENDLSLGGSRRSSVVPVSSTEKQVSQPRASSAPRSSAVVGNAYALKAMPDMDMAEPEQFLRRKTLDAHRSVHVLKKDHWQDDIGMGIEITDERPSLETPPSRLDALLNTARRVMVVNAVGGSLQRSVTSLRDVGERRSSRISSSPTRSLFTAALSASHSEPILQIPKVEVMEALDVTPADQLAIEEPYNPIEIPNVPQLNNGMESIRKYSPRPLSKTARAEAPTLELNLPVEDGTLQPIRRRTVADISIPMAVAQLKSEEHCAEVEGRMRSRSNSLGSEGIVRLAPLPSTPKPLVQEFLTPPEPENTVPISEPDAVQEEEVCMSSPDPDVIIYPTVELPIETEEGIALVTCKESVDELPVPEFQIVTNDIQARENGDLRTVKTTLTADDDAQGVEPTACQLRLPLDNEQVVSPYQTARKDCWEEPELPVHASGVQEEAIGGNAEMESLPERDEILSERPVAMPIEMKGPSFTEIPSVEPHSEPLELQNLPNEVSLHSQQSSYDYGEVLSYDNNEGRDDQADDNETGIHFASTNFTEHSAYNSLEMAEIGEAEGGDEIDSTDGTNRTAAGGMESSHNAKVDPSRIGAVEDIIPQDVPLRNDFDHDRSDNDRNIENASFSAADNIDEASKAPFGDEPSSARMEFQYAEELLMRGTSDSLHEKPTSVKSRSENAYPIQEESHSEDSTSFQQTAEEERRMKISAKPKTLTASVGPTNSSMLKTSTTSIGSRKQLADSSPQRQKSGGCRRRSLSPTKRYDLSQAKTNVKEVGSRRRSTVAKVANPLPLGRPRLERSHSVEDMKQEIPTASRSSNTNDPSNTLPDLPSPSSKLCVKPSPHKSPSPILRSKSQELAKRQSSQQSKVVQSVSNYHKKWGKWIAGKNLIEKVGCLQLEELVMADPKNEENLLKLGLRYARWSSTSMQAILLLEHAALLHKNVTGTREYWFWLGSAHLDIFMRHRKYLPVARFHLSRSLRAFTSAFAYMESLADPILLLRYAIGLFWHKGDGNLEKTRDIFHELFSQFVSFCDKERPNLLFLQFQVLHRLKLYVDAIDCMNRIISLHESLPNQSPSSSAAVLPSMNTIQHFAVYDTADYRLMLMQCQQAGGDYVAAAQSLASILKHEGMQQDTVVRDEEYFDLWFSLAEKCFLHEDYALALEYYAIALNFAKQSQALAAIHYNLGLCFQSLGEDSKCTTEYKRARTANRHVPPLVSLVELTTSYDERFVQLLQKSVVQTIEEVRVELYGRAVRRLQRVFRQSRRNLNINSNSEISQTKMPSLSKRRLSIAVARNLPALVRIEDISEEAEAHEEESLPQQVLPVDGNQTSKLDDSAFEDVERRHESFLVRKQAAMEEIVQLLANPQYRGREVSNTKFKATTQLRSGFLSPEKDQLDARRKQSMETYRQLGYVSSTMPWIEFWEKLLALASELFESRLALYGSIARIRGRLPLVTDEVAFCALAESIGNVHKAAEKLHDHSYERELTYVCAVVEVSKQLARDFPLKQMQSPLKAPHLSLPTIPTPTADPTAPHSPPSLGGVPSRRVVLPPYSPTPVVSISCSPKPKTHVRMNQMLDFHFQEHVQKQEAAIAIAEATGGFVQQQRRTEKLMVLQDFRQANRVLLSSQLAFGSEKAAT